MTTKLKNTTLYNKNVNDDKETNIHNNNNNNTNNIKEYDMNDAISKIVSSWKKYKIWYNDLNGEDAYEFMFCNYEKYNDYIGEGSD